MPNLNLSPLSRHKRNHALIEEDALAALGVLLREEAKPMASVGRSYLPNLVKWRRYRDEEQEEEEAEEEMVPSSVSSSPSKTPLSARTSVVDEESKSSTAKVAINNNSSSSQPPAADKSITQKYIANPQDTKPTQWPFLPGQCSPDQYPHSLIKWRATVVDWFFGMADADGFQRNTAISALSTLDAYSMYNLFPGEFDRVIRGVVPPQPLLACFSVSPAIAADVMAPHQEGGVLTDYSPIKRMRIDEDGMGGKSGESPTKKTKTDYSITIVSNDQQLSPSFFHERLGGMSKGDYLLAAISSFCIATKANETTSHHMTHDNASNYALRGEFEPSAIAGMELAVLKTTGFNINTPTVNTFIQEMLPLLLSRPFNEDDEVWEEEGHNLFHEEIGTFGSLKWHPTDEVQAYIFKSANYFGEMMAYSSAFVSSANPSKLALAATLEAVTRNCTTSEHQLIIQERLESLSQIPGVGKAFEYDKEVDEMRKHLVEILEQDGDAEYWRATPLDLDNLADDDFATPSKPPSKHAKSNFILPPLIAIHNALNGKEEGKRKRSAVVNLSNSGTSNSGACPGGRNHRMWERIDKSALAKSTFTIDVGTELIINSKLDEKIPFSKRVSMD